MLEGAFNQEKALVGGFSVIVKTDCETDGSFYSTSLHLQLSTPRIFTPHILQFTSCRPSWPLHRPR